MARADFRQRLRRLYGPRPEGPATSSKSSAPDVETYWFHHRCYIAKATDNFLMPSRTGIEFVDPDQEHWDINHWVRGGCLYGSDAVQRFDCMPRRTTVRAIPRRNCLASTRSRRSHRRDRSPSRVPEAGRLEKVPAFGTNTRGRRNGDIVGDKDDWPTYRHDPEEPQRNDRKADRNPR